MATDTMMPKADIDLVVLPGKSHSSPDNINKPATKFAYMMSRFPKLTETFVLFEMLALESHGATVEVFPLLRARNSSTHPEGAGIWKKFCELFRRPESTAVMHPEAKPFVDRAHFAPLFNLSIAKAQLHFLLRKPGAYLGALWTLLRANFGSANYLLGGLVLFPKQSSSQGRCSNRGISHLHAHFANHPAAAAYVIHRLTGISYSFTAHGADLQVDQHMLKEKVGDAKFVVAISRDNVELIKSVCGSAAAERVKVVRCGVDTHVFKPARETSTPGATQGLQIVCTGTLYEVKGHRYLIDACRVLAEQGIPFDCNLVGDGPLMGELKTQTVEAGLQDQVHFLGRRTRDEIASLMGRSDVLVAPSVPTQEGRREGIPVVLMEAMASGLPVVATRLSGIPELVEHDCNGLLVEPRDAVAIAQALTQLHKDEKRRKELGLAGRQTILDHYDLHANAEKLMASFCGSDDPQNSTP